MRRRALLFQAGARSQQGGKTFAVEDIVAKNHGNAFSGTEILPDDECVSKAARTGLGSVADFHSPARPVTEEALKQMGFVGICDYEDLAYPGQHEGRERIIDHRLVEDRHELFAEGSRHGVQAGAASAREDDAFLIMIFSGCSGMYPLARARAWRGDGVQRVVSGQQAG